MTEHMRYPHVERFGTPDVEGIEVGECLVFPKLDGTNASVWYAEGELYAGSRGRLLGPGNADNHGFHFAALTDWANPYSPISKFYAHPARRPLRLFGEWLVPHTFKHYREDVWRRFWVFDVFDHIEDRWVTFDEYLPWLQTCGMDFVPPIAAVTNPTEEQLRKIAEGNFFLVQDGAGPGEGVVLKRYDFVNHFGRTTWAKVVRNEFKDEHLTAMGVPEKGEVFQVEVAIAQEFVTPALVAKERAKIEAAILTEHDQFVAVPALASPEYDALRKQVDLDRRACLHAQRGKLIPRLLETVYHCVVTEELWAALKKYKDPTIDFRKLRRYCIAQTKKLAGDLF